MLIDRIYSERDIAQIFAGGVSPQATALWPSVEIPGAVEAVARADLMNDPTDPYLREALEHGLRPRRGFRTAWGCIVVDHGQDEDGLDERLLLNITGYLADDPYLQLPHLRASLKISRGCALWWDVERRTPRAAGTYGGQDEEISQRPDGHRVGGN